MRRTTRVLALAAAGCWGCVPQADEVPQGPPPWLGLCDGWGSPSLPTDLDEFGELDLEVERMSDLGLNFVRPHRGAGHVFAMSVVHPDEGTWDFTLADHVVEAAQRLGTHLLVTLQPEANLDDNVGGVTSIVAEADLGPWSAYVQRVVDRYDGDGAEDMPGLRFPVYAWEIGNEPRCEDGGLECLDGFVHTVRVAWESAHQQDPDAIVMAGGALPLWNGQVAERQVELWTHFFDQGGAQFSDAFSFHQGSAIAWPSFEDYQREWARIVPPEVPLWMSESGPYGAEGTSVHPDPEEAARWYLGELEKARSAGVEHAMFCLAHNEIDDHPELMRALQEYASGGLR